ncbi:TPA: hypothetical protein ACP3ZG_001663 [Pseudomonas aeruginosa]|uniref:hypothetical protein n=1 Tax=Pseudomonas aeruginosa TaxID=287 RepID=UPI0015C508D0|nr:hypothetical protein [Pseudomonas aeruginosa]ELG7182168.1 hypothetical protein [Pseudomonas aeruginosa]MBI8852452.1 hypothetical protein [Pseudomonas aeruginosa]
MDIKIIVTTPERMPRIAISRAVLKRSPPVTRHADLADAEPISGNPVLLSNGAGSVALLAEPPELLGREPVLVHQPLLSAATRPGILPPDFAEARECLFHIVFGHLCCWCCSQNGAGKHHHRQEKFLHLLQILVLKTKVSLQA